LPVVQVAAGMLMLLKSQSQQWAGFFSSGAQIGARDRNLERPHAAICDGRNRLK
jgi:hypothetical protein